MQKLWRVADKSPGAYVLLALCFYAVLVPHGALDGLYEGGTPASWPTESLEVVDENPTVEAALRCCSKTSPDRLRLRLRLRNYLERWAP